jgi:uncharacterized membrane protein
VAHSESNPLRTRRTSLLVAAGGIALAASVPALAGASFQVLGQGVAHGVSADGSVVVGSNSAGAFRWSFGGGFTQLDGLSAIAASDDGSIVGGNVLVGTLEQAARWVGESDTTTTLPRSLRG